MCGLSAGYDREDLASNLAPQLGVETNDKSSGIPRAWAVAAVHQQNGLSPQNWAPFRGWVVECEAVLVTPNFQPNCSPIGRSNLGPDAKALIINM